MFVDDSSISPRSQSAPNSHGSVHLAHFLALKDQDHFHDYDYDVMTTALHGRLKLQISMLLLCPLSTPDASSHFFPLFSEIRTGTKLV